MISKQEFLRITLLIRSQKHTYCIQKITEFSLSFRLRREAAEVDRLLEASQTETARLQTLARTREAEVQALRERVMRQRAERARRLAEQERQLREYEEQQQQGSSRGTQANEA